MGDIFVSTTGNKDVIRGEHMDQMKHQAIVCNIGHFDSEIQIAYLIDRSDIEAVRIKTPADEGGPVDKYVYPDGRAINIADAIQRASHRDSSEKPSAIKPGEVYEYSFRVGSTAIRFAKGHRIRIEVASTNFPTFERNLNKFRKKRDGGYFDGMVATQRIFHDSRYPSHITLPLVPAA